MSPARVGGLVRPFPSRGQHRRCQVEHGIHIPAGVRHRRGVSHVALYEIDAALKLRGVEVVDVQYGGVIAVLHQAPHQPYSQEPRTPCDQYPFQGLSSCVTALPASTGTESFSLVDPTAGDRRDLTLGRAFVPDASEVKALSRARCWGFRAWRPGKPQL